MPLIKKEIDNSAYQFGIWQIDEEYDDLLSILSLDEDDMKKLGSFQNPARKMEWLSVRTCLKSLINCNTGIYYNERRKPFLKDNSYLISISHSHNWSSVLLSAKHKVGIDLEYMSHRIGKISHRFMNKDEYISPHPDLQFYHLYIHWCAKEALYKICDKDGLNFKTDLLIEPFEPKENGILAGSVYRDNQREDYKLKYFKFDNYIVVWCIK